MCQGSESSSNRNAPSTGSHSPLVVVVIAMGGGIFAGRFLSLPLAVWIVGAILFLVVWRFAFRSRANRPWVAEIALLLSVAMLSGAWMVLHWNTYQEDELGLAASEIAEPICLEVIALRAPWQIDTPPDDPTRIIPEEDRSVLPVRVVRVRNGQQWREASGNTEITINGHLLGISSGDQLRVFGQFSKCKSPRTPGAFDYAAYRRGERRLCQIWAENPSCIEKLARNARGSFRQGVDRIRQSAGKQIDQYISMEQSPLAAAILIGERKGVDREEIDLFFKTGTMHLLALSGLHVGILALIINLASQAGLLHRRKALFLILGIAIGYALLADVRPSVVRAATLLCFVCAGELMRRPIPPFNGLAAAALVVFILNPSDLFSLGFQLSFLAAATLISLRQWKRRRAPIDPIKRLIAQSRPWVQQKGSALLSWFLQISIAGIGVWLITLPLVAYQFHMVAFVGILVNPLLWIPMVVGLAAGFFTVISAWIAPPLAPIFGAACSECLHLLQLGVAWGKQLPGGHFWTAGPLGAWVIGFYLLLFSWVVLQRWRPPRRWAFTLAMLYLALGIASAPGALPKQGHSKTIQASFISVGHGICSVIELPNGKTLMYDAGCLGSPLGGAREVSAFLWSRGITHLDAVVLSHADADHYNILPHLLERFSVGVIYVSPVMFEEETPALVSLSQAIEEAAIPIEHLQAGDRLESGTSFEIEILHPPPRGIIGNDNANSIVMAVQFAGRRLLLTGDLESRGLADVMAEEPLDCDIVLAPHHGSAKSNPHRFAAWATPEWVVISGGRLAEVPSLVSTFQGENRQVMHTAREGTIQFRISRESIIATPYRTAAGD